MEQQIAKRKIYTGVGDKGHTNFFGSNRKISKANLRIEAYGTLDEVNAFFGFAIVALKSHEQLINLVKKCLRIQNELFGFGAQLANYPLVVDNISIISLNEIKMLEEEIDSMDLQLTTLNNFILPGGNNEAVARLQVTRTICRRLERVMVRLLELVKFDELMLVYLNRLSDWLFVAARFTGMLLKQNEVVWQKEDYVG